MCDPTTALVGAQFPIGAAQAGAKYGAAQEDANSMAKMQAQERLNAEIARNQTWNQLGLRQQQEHEAGSQSLFDSRDDGLHGRVVGHVAGLDLGGHGGRALGFLLLFGLLLDLVCLSLLHAVWQAAIERLPSGVYFIWHDWRKGDPIAGPLYVGQVVQLEDGRMVMRKGPKRVKWYIPADW